MPKTQPPPIHHTIHGNPTSIHPPIVCVHGGPGGESQPKHVLPLFNLRTHRVILYDQRGCGRSGGDLTNNTPFTAVDDLDHVRKHYGYDKVTLFGGSYGTAVVLLYLLKHPNHVASYILRGVFLLGDVFSRTLRHARPTQWKRLCTLTQRRTLRGVSRATARALGAPARTPPARDTAHTRALVRAWCALEDSALVAPVTPPRSNPRLSYAQQRQYALFESWFDAHRFFVPRGYDILDACKRARHTLRHVRGLIVHGEDDIVCPVRNAKRLWHALGGQASNVRLVVVPKAWHSIADVRMKAGLIEAMRVV